MKKFLYALMIFLGLISLCACNFFNTSVDSNETLNEGKTKLLSPSNIRLDDENSRIVWSFDENCKKYIVLINGEDAYTVTTNSYILENKSYNNSYVTVKAVSTNNKYSDSDYSDKYYFTYIYIYIYISLKPKFLGI